MTETGEKLGLAAAVDEVVEQIGVHSLVPVEQLSLLDEKAEDGSPVPVSLNAKRGPGRPKGAQNKSSKEWAQMMLSKYQSPLVFLFETFNRPVEALAAELGCDNLEAFKVQQAAAGKAAEYVHQKMPMAVDLKTEDTAQIYLFAGPQMMAAAQAGDAGAMLVTASAAEDAELVPDEGENKTEKNQQVSEVTP